MVFHNWKDSFELPHESNWSLYQKKCFLNGYSTKELTYSRSSTNDAMNFSILYVYFARSLDLHFYFI